MFKTLFTLALRHYKDPLSWAGIVSAVGAATHHTFSPELAGYMETILGAIVGILLLLADGRKNPNTDASGAIPPRDPAVVIMQSRPPAAPRSGK